MCYSAQAWQDYEKFQRETDSPLSMKEYVKFFWDWKSKGTPYKIPKAMMDAFNNPKTDDERKIHGWIEEWKIEQAAKFEQELFKQKKRLADAERMLKSKVTKKAENDQRVATNKISQLKVKLDDLKRIKSLPKDSRFFPGNYSTVLASEGGKKFVAPMRYQCRLAGKPESYDKRYPGTYNARRDNLEGFWKGQFGYTHGIIVVETFYENVETDEGRNQVLQFTPSDGGPMYVACLWSRWLGEDGEELLSFAAITDDPEPEVAAAGHDRTIINIKPEHIEAWLNPDPNNLQALYDIFDDKQHPYYENREAA
ncbi:SOS response-associated peptidase family protein [Solilutibacter tolerans]|uniref:Abasic site processing protein n=1 Tax=Solilutibacter tolerans TaxID=1604334 RepID=A0A1N6N3B3_9GAMM|nr:SOS response-associated peptidase family protein [Lysobacter tolerans]SIP86542.1 SOS response associated peptidase (SRAP) [Lysobacter tolerans]